MYYWLGYMDGEVEIELEPASVTIPSDEQMLAALVNNGIETEMYTGRG